MEQFENIWMLFLIISLLSLVAVFSLVENFRASLSVLKQASAGHHMLEIRDAQ